MSIALIALALLIIVLLLRTPLWRFYKALQAAKLKKLKPVDIEEYLKVALTPEEAKEAESILVEDLLREMKVPNSLSEKAVPLLQPKIEEARASELWTSLAYLLFIYLQNPQTLEAFAQARLDQVRNCKDLVGGKKLTHFIIRSHQAFFLDKRANGVELMLTVPEGCVVRVLVECGSSISNIASYLQVHNYRRATGTKILYEFTAGMQIPNFVFYHKMSECHDPITVMSKSSAHAKNLTDQFFNLQSIIAQARERTKKETLCCVLLAGCNTPISPVQAQDQATANQPSIFHGFTGEVNDLEIQLQAPKSHKLSQVSSMDPSLKFSKQALAEPVSIASEKKAFVHSSMIPACAIQNQPHRFTSGQRQPGMTGDLSLVKFQMKNPERQVTDGFLQTLQNPSIVSSKVPYLLRLEAISTDDIEIYQQEIFGTLDSQVKEEAELSILSLSDVEQSGQRTDREKDLTELPFIEPLRISGDILGPSQVLSNLD